MSEMSEAARKVMVDELKLFAELGIPAEAKGGVILIPRASADSCAEALLREGVRLTGIDGFVVSADGRKRPTHEIIEWTETQPEIGWVLKSLCAVPVEITHFEFVIDFP